MVPSMVKPRKFIIISLAVFMAALSAEAQSFREEIAENPDRAGTIFHYYEYATSPMTKVPSMGPATIRQEAFSKMRNWLWTAHGRRICSLKRA